MEDTRGTWLLESTKQGTCQLRETDAAIKGLHESIPDPLHMYYSYLLSIFMGLLTVKISRSQTLVSELCTLPQVGLLCPTLV